MDNKIVPTFSNWEDKVKRMWLINKSVRTTFETKTTQNHKVLKNGQFTKKKTNKRVSNKQISLKWRIMLTK